jgi:hypothetical protein
MATRNNPSTVAPNLPFPEKSRQTYDTTIAQNTRRRGPLQAEEGLGFEPTYSSSFAGGAASDKADHVTFEVQQAPHARGRLASGQEIPAWNAVDAQMRARFVQGDSSAEQSVTARPFMHQPRPGANMNPLGPTWGFSAASERPGAVFQTSVAPPNGGRGRRNQADVTEVL